MNPQAPHDDPTAGHPVPDYQETAPFQKVPGAGPPPPGHFPVDETWYSQTPGAAPPPGGHAGAYGIPQVLPPARKKRRWVRRVLFGIIGLVVLLTVVGIIGAVTGAKPAVSDSVRGATASPVNTPSASPTGTGQADIPAAPAPAGPQVIAVGQSAQVSDGTTNAAEGSITVESARVLTYPVQSYGSRPANGYFVVVHVKAAADASYADGFDISEADFYGLAGSRHYDNGNGNSYDALTDYQNAQDLGYTTLGAGEATDGWLAFDVPSRHGYIVYAPNADSQPLAEWKY